MEEFHIKEVLTEAELQAFHFMKTVEHNSIYGTEIKNVCANPDGEKIRELVAELKSQAVFGQNCLQDILGDACYKIIYA